MPDAAERLRTELREIGDRRLDLQVAITKLEEDTTNAVKRAKGKLSMSEAADLLGLHRTSCYSTYGAGRQ